MCAGHKFATELRCNSPETSVPPKFQTLSKDLADTHAACDGVLGIMRTVPVW